MDEFDRLLYQMIPDLDDHLVNQILDSNRKEKFKKESPGGYYPFAELWDSNPGGEDDDV